ncbi:serine hydrolase [Ekhidna sp.]|uniref:serine hydrolase n=1 Tax=Ekhidna sp. TaxID=2608089 RepID=UPI003297511D
MKGIALVVALGASTFLFGQPNPRYPVDSDQLNAIVEKMIEERNIPGLAIGIVRADVLEYFYTYGYADKKNKIEIETETGFQIASLTKPIIAILAMKLYEDGKIDIHKPVQNYLPYADIPKAIPPVSMAHLLTHSSGLPEEPVNRVNLSNTPSVPKPYSKEELYDGLKNTQLLFTPGTSVQYSNLGFKLAGHVLEEVAKSTLEELLKSEILEPLKMNSTYAQNKPLYLNEASHYWNVDNAAEPHARWKIGEIWGNGGLTSTIGDMSKFLSLQFKRSSSVEGVISPSHIVLSQVSKIPTNRSHSEFIGFGWYIGVDEKVGKHLFHTGNADGHSSYISFSPEDGVGFIVLANRGNVADDIGEELHEVIYNELSLIKRQIGMAFSEGNWQTLLQKSSELIGLNPSNSRAHYLKGKALYMLSEYKEAVSYLNVAIKDNIYKDYALFYQASCMANLGEDEKAIEYLSQAVNLGFNDGDALMRDSNLSRFSHEPSFKKLAEYAH